MPDSDELSGGARIEATFRFPRSPVQKPPSSLLTTLPAVLILISTQAMPIELTELAGALDWQDRIY